MVPVVICFRLNSLTYDATSFKLLLATIPSEIDARAIAAASPLPMIPCPLFGLFVRVL